MYTVLVGAGVPKYIVGPFTLHNCNLKCEHVNPQRNLRGASYSGHLLKFMTINIALRAILIEIKEQHEKNIDFLTRKYCIISILLATICYQRQCPHSVLPLYTKSDALCWRVYSRTQFSPYTRSSPLTTTANSHLSPPLLRFSFSCLDTMQLWSEIGKDRGDTLLPLGFNRRQCLSKLDWVCPPWLFHAVFCVRLLLGEQKVKGESS
jgi:hypothetical protein